MNKNSNTYQIVYSAIMVVIVGAVLALIYMVLKPQQDRNRDNDTRKQILAAINVTPEDDEAIAADYKTHIVKEYIVDDKGAVTDSSENVAFNVNMAKNIKATKRLLPVFVANVKGETKYIFPVYGFGDLFGAMWLSMPMARPSTAPISHTRAKPQDLVRKSLKAISKTSLRASTFIWTVLLNAWK